MDSRVGDSIGADGIGVPYSRMPSGYWTGVGSRRTPLDVQRDFARVAQQLAQRGWVLRSGAADGADIAFERGVDDAFLKEIFIPFNGFRGGSLIEGERARPRTTAEPGVYLVPDALRDRAIALAASVHPNWNAVLAAARAGRDFALEAHTRNAFQVLGRDLETPSAFTVLWAPPKGDSVDGGTATALQLSRRHGIPTYNFAVAHERDAFFSMLAELLARPSLDQRALDLPPPPQDVLTRAGPTSAPTATLPAAVAVVQTDPGSPTALAPMRTSATMSTTDTEQRFHTIKDPDTRLIAGTIGRLGGVFAHANAEWVFPGSDYISRNLEYKKSTAVSDKADALIELYHATRPSPEQMVALEQIVKTMPYEMLGIKAQRGSLKAKAEIAALLNPNVISKTRVEFLVARAGPYLQKATEKQIESVMDCVARGYDMIAWGFDAKAEPHKLWAWEGAPKGVGPTVGRARELITMARPYVEADRRRQENALIRGDLEHSNGALNYAAIDTNSDAQLNVVRRIETEGGVANKRLADLDRMRERRTEQEVREGHNERVQSADHQDVQRERGFEGENLTSPLQKARGEMDYVLREYLEATTAFQGSDIVLREPRPNAKLSGQLVQYIKINDGTDDHFLAAIQHAGARVETPSHFAIHREDGKVAIGYNVSASALKGLQSRDDVVKVIGPVTFAEAVQYAKTHDLPIAVEPDQKVGPITEKPSRTFTVVDSRTFDRPVETGAPVRVEFREPVPTHYVVMDIGQRYSIVTDRDEATTRAFATDALKKVAGPFTLERAQAYADVNKLDVVTKPAAEVGEMPTIVTFAGIGMKTRDEILNLAPDVMQQQWGFSPVVLEQKPGAALPVRQAVNPPERPDFWQAVSRDEAIDLIRKAADVDPRMQAREDARHMIESRAVAANGTTGHVPKAAEIPLPRLEAKTVEGMVLFNRDGIVAIDRGFNRFSLLQENEVRGKIPADGKQIKITSHPDKPGFDVAGARVSRRVATA